MFAVILCTAPAGEAEKVARPLVEEKLVACINVAEVKSFFQWEGKMEAENEALLIMKTRTDKIDDVTERIKSLHSYSVPEVIALPIIGGFEGYLGWVKDSVE